MADYEDRWRGERYGRGRERDYPWGSPDYDRDDFRGLYEGRREGHWQDDRQRRGVYGQGPSYGRGFEEDRNYGRDYGRDYGRGDDRSRERGLLERAGDEVASWFGSDEAERRRRLDEAESGRYRGRGPRGYQRSDQRILEDCNDRLTDDPWVDASDIGIRVEGCEVTLTGTVDSRQAKRRAEDIVDSVSGVRNVQNNLRVRDQAADSGYAIGQSGTAGVSGAGQTGDLGATRGRGE